MEGAGEQDKKGQERGNSYVSMKSGAGPRYIANTQESSYFHMGSGHTMISYLSHSHLETSMLFVQPEHVSQAGFQMLGPRCIFTEEMEGIKQSSEGLFHGEFVARGHAFT